MGYISHHTYGSSGGTSSAKTPRTEVTPKPKEETINDQERNASRGKNENGAGNTGENLSLHDFEATTSQGVLSSSSLSSEENISKQMGECTMDSTLQAKFNDEFR